MTTSLGNQIQLLSDGERLILLTNQGALVMDDVHLTQSAVNIKAPAYCSTSLTGGHFFQAGPRWTEVDLSFVGGCTQFKEQKNFLLGQDLFRKITVMELFKVINTKIEER